MMVSGKDSCPWQPAAVFDTTWASEVWTMHAPTTCTPLDDNTPLHDRLHPPCLYSCAAEANWCRPSCLCYNAKHGHWFRSFQLESCTEINVFNHGCTTVPMTPRFQCGCVVSLDRICIRLATSIGQIIPGPCNAIGFQKLSCGYLSMRPLLSRSSMTHHGSDMQDIWQFILTQRVAQWTLLLYCWSAPSVVTYSISMIHVIVWSLLHKHEQHAEPDSRLDWSWAAAFMYACSRRLS